MVAYVHTHRDIKFGHTRKNITVICKRDFHFMSLNAAVALLSFEVYHPNGIIKNL